VVRPLAQGSAGHRSRRRQPLTVSRLAALAVAIAATASCIDPVVPGGGTPTLDDPGVGSVVSVSVGREHSCALTAAGDAWCWGNNEFGQVGIPHGTVTCAREDRAIPCEPAPRAVSGGRKFQRIAAGGSHTCAIAVDGHLFCWGSNANGQLGDPTSVQATAPVAPLSAALYSDIAAGDQHTCALRTDGVVLCWGANEFGQLAASTAGTGFAVPTVAQTNLRFVSLSAGVQRTCARQSLGTTYCWGSQWLRRSSDGSEVTRAQSPPLLVASPAFRQISVGVRTTCGLTLEGEAWCWEANPTGTIGDGSTLGSTIPQPVKTSMRFAHISAGANGTCGVADTGLAYCWGAGDAGQLGVSPSSVGGRCESGGQTCVLSPNRVSGWREFAAISAGLGDHVCGLTVSGSVYCWGAGSMGQRGDGSRGNLWSPTAVPIP